MFAFPVVGGVGACGGRIVDRRCAAVIHSSNPSNLSNCSGPHVQSGNRSSTTSQTLHFRGAAGVSLVDAKSVMSRKSSTAAASRNGGAGGHRRASIGMGIASAEFKDEQRGAGTMRCKDLAFYGMLQ